MNMNLNVLSRLAFILLSFVMLSIVHIGKAEEELTSKIISRNEQIIVFVSFSMPEPALKSWLLDAQKVGALVVTRGLINNSFKETLQAFAKLIGGNTSVGIQIDPELFRDYGIDQVPAVVVTQNSASKSFDVIQGNTTMRYALQMLFEKGEIQSVQLKQALAKLGGMYE